VKSISVEITINAQGSIEEDMKLLYDLLSIKIEKKDHFLAR
jgi:hypothetical protein